MAELLTYKCNICGHEWIPRKATKPKYCANCHSPRWNDPEGRKRPYYPDQLAAAKVRRLEEAEKTLEIPITEGMRKAALAKLNLLKPANGDFKIGITNAGPWNDMPDEEPPRISLFDLMGYDDDTDELWMVNTTENNGLCLTGDDIYPGDVIHFRNGLQPENDDIVLALGHDLDGHFFITAKHWCQTGTNFSGKPIVELRPSNPNLQPIKAFPFNVEISGVAIGVFRKNLRHRRPNGKSGFSQSNYGIEAKAYKRRIRMDDQ